jgi:hypothetical protein
MNSSSLQEISPNHWKAIYHGNYGVYTIIIKTDGEKTIDFSCTCPSCYCPCKHIRMIEDDIKKQIEKSKKIDRKYGIALEKLLSNVSQKELTAFIIKASKRNPQLKNSVYLEFFHKIEAKETKDYAQVIRNALNKLDFDFDDLDYETDTISIDLLDQWLGKAQSHVDEGNTSEAILICKACIEEFATWYDKNYHEVFDYLEPNYQERPFDILIEIASMPEVNNKELSDYCKSEMNKPKYEKTQMRGGFGDLLKTVNKG